MISKLVTGRVDGEGLTDDEGVSFLRLLIPAGAETTFKLLGNLFVALLSDREARWERVRADRSLIPWAIEETLRWESSVLMVSRQAMRDVEIRGVAIPAGTNISVLTASGNRDEDHYENPDVYDLDRRADDHLAFAFGRHHCLGYHLARMEVRLALDAMLDRLPKLRLDPAADPPRILGLAFRAPKRVDVRLDDGLTPAPSSRGTRDGSVTEVGRDAQTARGECAPTGSIRARAPRAERRSSAAARRRASRRAPRPTGAPPPP